MSMNLKKYKNPPRKFRAAPFWSWNDKLDPELLKYQVSEMSRVGLGGYFMHARGGISTEYMSEDWMDAFSACIEEGRKTGMLSWGYDEEGFPSGFAGGAVQARGEKYWMKWLERNETDSYEPAENVIAVYLREGKNYQNLPLDQAAKAAEGQKIITIIRGINPSYVDVLNPETIRIFLDETHEKYYARFGDAFGKDMPGFFTDEPQFGLIGVPWSDTLPDRYREAYNREITEGLYHLFMDDEEGNEYRYRFWKLINRLYTESFIKQMGEWCEAHHCKLTGHVMGEDNVMSQMHATAGCMPAYEHFHIPGIDWLGRDLASDFLPKQVSSVAAQLGKKQVLSEMFGLTGWDVSPAELKWIAEWQYVNGISYMCQHLEGYTLRGLRKRDYPPSLFYQLPWWDDYKYFNDYFGRLSMLLTEGTESAPVLVVHNLTSAWMRSNYLDTTSLLGLQDSMEDVIQILGSHQIGYHFGDEQLMAKYASVSKGVLRVGKGRYKAVVLPEMVNIEASTLKLLKRFASEGGKIFAYGDLPVYVSGEKSKSDWLRKNVIRTKNEADLCAALAKCEGVVLQRLKGEGTGRIRIMRRDKKDHTLLYIVNTDNTKAASFTLKTSGSTLCRLNMETVCAEPVPYKRKDGMLKTELALEPADSILLAIDAPIEVRQKREKKEQEVTVVTLPETLTIEKIDDNALTLDSCEYRVNGGEWMPKKAVILIVNELLALRKPCTIELRYHFEVACPPEKLGTMYLAAETVNNFEMTLNGYPVKHDGHSWWIDTAFQKCDITGMVKEGINEILVKTDFYQKDIVYEVLFGNDKMGTGFNKLTFDTELESMYIIGNFGVYAKDGFTSGERNALFTGNDFYIAERVNEVKRGSITEQGFTFFAGSVQLAFDAELKKDGSRIMLKYKQRAAVTKITVNGKPVRTVCWAPYETDITDFVQDGTNHIVIEAISGNRSLLGPHHHIWGETYFPGPSSFTDIGGWPERELNGKPIWRDGFCVVTFGIE